MAKKGMKRPESTASAAQNRSQSGAQNMAGGSKGICLSLILELDSNTHFR